MSTASQRKLRTRIESKQLRAQLEHDNASNVETTYWVSRDRYTFVSVLCAVLAVVVVALALSYHSHHDARPSSLPYITEDSTDPITGLPLWDCRTMGNQDCGPGSILPNGNPAVPGHYEHGIWASPFVPAW